MLTQPLPDLAAWTAWFRDLPIPVLPATAAELQHLAQREAQHGDIDAHRISEVIAGDPLMTLRVLAHAATHRRPSQITDADTVTAAVMLMGIDAFFRTFGTLETVDTAPPSAQAGLQAVLDRAHRAAQFALGFAVHRMDSHAAVLQQAALLHDVAEMLLWCHAPALAGDIARRLHADPTLRSADVQQAVLHTPLGALQQHLLRAWHLPTLLIQLTNDHAAPPPLIEPQVRTVRLAVRLARHTQATWHNAALGDDVAETAQLLNLSPRAAEHLLLQLNS